MSDNTAILAGYTREVMASGGAYELHLFIQPGTDLDDTFKAYDADECEWLLKEVDQQEFMATRKPQEA